MVISKVAKFSGERKIIEIPKESRDEFNVGDKVKIRKVKNGS
jgi:uncharacterized membrane protein (UPF0127 family)